MQYKLTSTTIQNPEVEVLRNAIPSRVAAMKIVENMIGTMLTKYPMTIVNKSSSGIIFILPKFRVEITIDPDPQPEIENIDVKAE